jgi:hypothetical protein
MLKYWLVEIRDRECKLVDQTRLPGDASKVQRQAAALRMYTKHSPYTLNLEAIEMHVVNNIGREIDRYIPEAV